MRPQPAPSIRYHRHGRACTPTRRAPPQPAQPTTRPSSHPSAHPSVRWHSTGKPHTCEPAARPCLGPLPAVHRSDLSFALLSTRPGDSPAADQQAHVTHDRRRLTTNRCLHCASPAPTPCPPRAHPVPALVLRPARREAHVPGQRQRVVQRGRAEGQQGGYVRDVHRRHGAVRGVCLIMPAALALIPPPTHHTTHHHHARREEPVFFFFLSRCETLSRWASVASFRLSFCFQLVEIKSTLMVVQRSDTQAGCTAAVPTMARGVRLRRRRYTLQRRKLLRGALSRGVQCALQKENGAEASLELRAELVDKELDVDLAILVLGARGVHAGKLLGG